MSIVPVAAVQVICNSCGRDFDPEDYSIFAVEELDSWLDAHEWGWGELEDGTEIHQCYECSWGEEEGDGLD